MLFQQTFPSFKSRILTRATLVCAFLVIPGAISPHRGANAAESLGSLMVNVPFEVEKGQPFEFDVWLAPKDPNFNGIVKVFMENTPKIKYEPREFELKPGERKRVTATVAMTSSGLSILYCYAANWDPVDLTITTGFTARLKVNNTEPLQSGTTRDFVLSFIDKDGQPVRLDANANVYVRGSKLSLFASDTQLWREDIIMPLTMGTMRSMPIQMKARTWTADTGVLSLVVTTAQGNTIYDDAVYIPLLPPWYAPLVMAIIGGLIYSVGEFFKNVFSRCKTLRAISLKAAASATTGIVAGVVAYLLASWNILGIKIDATGLKGFVILGFLFSYVGVDIILKSATGKHKV